MFISPVNSADIEPEHLKSLFLHWDQIRGEKSMPCRKDFLPEKVPSLLAYLALFDVTGPPYRYFTRLVGTETVRAMGSDFTGKYLDEVPSLIAVTERFDGVAESGIPYLYKGKLIWSEKSFMDYYALALPFSDDDIKVNLLMYGMDYHIPKKRYSHGPL